jgi:transcriptional regulator with XRE-family HTH domain
MTINPKALKLRRNQLGMSLDRLAEVSSVNRQTIHRIEKGTRIAARAVTAERLAKALRCSEDDLQREPAVESGLATPDEPALPSGERPRVHHRVDPRIKNAYWLVSERYRVSEADIVRLAPLLFALVAEHSLANRKKRIDDWWGHLEKADDVAKNFKHLPPGRVFLTNRASDASYAEYQSIEANDIFGDRVDEELSDDDLSLDYSSDTDNPFVTFLQEYALRFVDVALVWSVTRGEAGYILFERRLRELACDDGDVCSRLRHGPICIGDIPEDLLDQARATDRLQWLRDRCKEIAASFPPPPAPI